MKKHFTSPLTYLLALALPIASGILSLATAQDLSSELISYPSKVLEQLPAKHRQVVSELTTVSGKTAHLVRLNPIKEAVRENSITLTLPGATSKTKIVLDKIEYFDADNYLVVGKVDKTPLTAIFSSKNGRKGGLIQGLESTYEIYDLEDEGQLLVKCLNVEAERNFCGMKEVKGNDSPLTPEVPAPGGRKSSANARVDPCTSNIRVLFLYTFAISQSTAFSFATNTINTLNTTISQSGVNNSTAYAEVAGYTSIGYSKSNSDIQADALNLSNNSTAQNLRNSYKADLVLLISHEIYGGDKGGVPDPSASPHPDNNRAYAIVALCSGGDQVVAAHELSHLYGCNHQYMAYGLPYSKAIAWSTGSGNPIQVSLVAGGNTPGTRILKYSNPYITGSGYLPDRNNTLVVDQNSGTVKSFQPEPNVLSAYIDGPYSGIAYHMYTFEAITSCGSAPYSYQWRVSTDGFNYGSVLGTGEFLILTCITMAVTGTTSS